MKVRAAISIVSVATALIAPALGQNKTLARLNHESVPEVTRPRIEARGSAESVTTHSEPLSESMLSRSAATALFVNANLIRARQLAERALRHDHRDAEALFVLMEAGGMQADEATVLNAALHLCEIGGGARQDPRIRLAAARILESAANTPEFRAVIPGLQTLLANSSADWPELNMALLDAAMDGVPRLDPEAIARASGILTEWRIVGPLGRHPLPTDQVSISPNDDLARVSYDNRAVENFQFPDGIIRLPSYLSPHGTFYAVTHFASLSSGTWTVRTEGAGQLEVYVDGKRLLLQETGLRQTLTVASATLEIPAGPHRVLAKFAGVGAPLRIAISPSVANTYGPMKARRSIEELTYELASSAYAEGQFKAAIAQINALPSPTGSAALQFLLAQSWSRENSTAVEARQAWSRVLSLAPGAIAADERLGQWSLAAGHVVEAAKFARRVLDASPNDITALETLGEAIDSDASLANSTVEARLLWSRRLTEHPSCETSNRAMLFYRDQGQSVESAAAQQRLNGCAPEPLAYAQLLANQGLHGQAAQALRQLLAAAPLNRSARLMLVRELQLAGDDSEAERAADAWLRIAPSASEYRRLAAAANSSDDKTSDTQPFYAPYRRNAADTMLQSTTGQFPNAPVMLVNDRVAILRPDGSVSLYVHTATRFSSADEIRRIGGSNRPHGAQLLQLRTLHADGSVTPIDLDPQDPRTSLPDLSPGDAIDEEYVVCYAGDGGIAEHPEVFQFVFGRFDEKVLRARFVVLTPAEQSDRGVVIASSDAPRLVSRTQNTMLARIWERDEVSVTRGGLVLPSNSLAIVRVVEQENNWMVPSDAEHHRRIETIHPGPRFEESSGTAKRPNNYAPELSKL